MANWSQVQTLDGGQVGSATPSLAASFGTNVTAGNRILLFTGNYSVGQDIDCTVASSPSLTWTKLASATIVPGDLVSVDLWTAVVAATGSLQITVSSTATSASCEMGWTAGEYSGLDPSALAGCLDVSAVGTGNTGGAATTSVATGTTTATHAAGQLAVAVYGDTGWSLTIAAPAGFSKQAGLSRDAANKWGQCVATKVSASAATEGGSFTYGSATVRNQALVAVIKTVTNSGVGPIAPGRTWQRRYQRGRRMPVPSIAPAPSPGSAKQEPMGVIRSW